MSKYKQGDMRAHTPQEKKNYWMQRIVNKANSSYRQFGKDMETIVDWAHHADMDDRERSNLALMMADRFSAIIRKLAPQNDEATETEEATDGEKATEAEDGKNNS